MIFLYFLNFKPKFVAPKRYFNSSKYFFYKTVIFLLLVTVILLPLNLWLLANKKVNTEKNIPIQIILDVSLSMSANDISPSRFDAAKSALLNLIEKLEWYNISLITFSWVPIVYLPFSQDTKAILSKLWKTNLGDFPPVTDFLGTAIGDALLLSVSNFEKIKTEKNWLIILITDWDSNKWYNPLQVMNILQKRQISVFSLWVGQQDFLIWYDTRNQAITTDINIPLLQTIAKNTWWEFYRILESENFDEFFQKLSQKIKSQEKQTIENKYLYLNDYLLRLILAACICLIYIKIKSAKKSD